MTCMYPPPMTYIVYPQTDLHTRFYTFPRDRVSIIFNSLSSPLVSAKACHMAKRKVGVKALAVICWSPCVQRRCCPTGRYLCLPTFSHFLIFNKASLYLSRSLALSLSDLALSRCLFTYV